MEHLDIILPITLLFLAFMLKLSIDRSIQAPNIIQAICELPVDMIFLAISFLVAFTISKPKDPSIGLFYTLAFIVVAVLVVILWRKSLKLFDGNNKYWVLVLLINMFITMLCLFQSMDVLLNQEPIKTKTESKIRHNGN